MNKQETNLGLVLIFLGVGFGAFVAFTSSGEIPYPNTGTSYSCQPINTHEVCRNGVLIDKRTGKPILE